MFWEDDAFNHEEIIIPKIHKKSFKKHIYLNIRS